MRGPAQLPGAMSMYSSVCGPIGSALISITLHPKVKKGRNHRTRDRLDSVPFWKALLSSNWLQHWIYPSSHPWRIDSPLYQPPPLQYQSFSRKPGPGSGEPTVHLSIAFASATPKSLLRVDTGIFRDVFRILATSKRRQILILRQVRACF
jgi:hypothetical protein